MARRRAQLTNARANRLRRERAAAHRASAPIKGTNASSNNKARSIRLPAKTPLRRPHSTAAQPQYLPVSSPFVVPESEEESDQEADYVPSPPAAAAAAASSQQSSSSQDSDSASDSASEEEPEPVAAAPVRTGATAGAAAQTVQAVLLKRTVNGAVEYLVNYSNRSSPVWVSFFSPSASTQALIDAYEANQKLYLHKWQYLVDDGVDNKNDGFYDLGAAQSAELEAFCATGNTRGIRQYVLKGVFNPHNGESYSYRVDLDHMTQTNEQTGRTRPLRRIATGMLLPSARSGPKLLA